MLWLGAAGLLFTVLNAFLKKLSQELQRQFKPTVIAVNKADLLEGRDVSPEDYLDYLTRQLRGLDYAPETKLLVVAEENVLGDPQDPAVGHNQVIRVFALG